MTTTLFQIHSDIDNLPSNLKKLSDVCHKNDSVLLMASTSTFISWVLEQEGSISFNLLSALPKLNWYALSTDVDNIHSNIDCDEYNQLVNNNKINLITDDEWVTLVNSADKVVGIY